MGNIYPCLLADQCPEFLRLTAGQKLWFFLRDNALYQFSQTIWLIYVKLILSASLLTDAMWPDVAVAHVAMAVAHVAMKCLAFPQQDGSRKA